MDRGNKLKKEVNPRETANFLSLVTFFYNIKLFIKGYTKSLEIEDVYEVSPDSRSKLIGENLEQQWQKEAERCSSPSICRALWMLYGKIFLFIGLVQCVITMVITTWSPKAVSKLISYFSPVRNHMTKRDAIFYASLVISLSLINTLVTSNFSLILVQLAIKAKVSISSLLYRKTLKLSSESLSKVTAGKIVTIITKDVDTIEIFMFSANAVWIAVIQIVLVCYLIYRQIGFASFSGIAFFLVVLPLQVYIGKMTYKYKLECSEKSDERLDLIRQVLAASKIIKLYAWEKFFEKKIYDARKTELKELHKLFYTKVWITIIGSICSSTAFFIFVLTYVWTGNNISAETIFYILSCFNNLECAMSNDIPFGFSYFVQLSAVANRIESVLRAEELPLRTNLIRTDDPKIVFNGVDAKIHDKTVLKNVSLIINSGLNMVVGHMGSGKTTFLKMILQECVTSGEVEITGSVSYASQEPWLFPSTIKNNILFGEKYFKKRYQEVLEVCSLKYDLDLLTEGDDTVVGEGGINLSKGQQARINLARAVYKNSDIYLFDDCLASLDANVSDIIFKNCIRKFLKRKICIFVTNNFEYLQNADEIIVVNSRSVKFKDEEVKHSQIEFSCDNNSKIDNEIEETNNSKINNEMEKTKCDEPQLTNRNMYHENKESGVVPLEIYLKYIKHGGGVLLFSLIAALFVLTQVATSCSEKIFSKWVTLETNYYALNETNTTDYQNMYKEKTYKLSLYIAVVAASIILSLLRSFSFFYFVQVASNNIHKTMVRNVINATMKFFDSHFIGNMINRFTKDFLTLDDTLPFVLLECLAMIFTASGGIVLLATVDYIFLFESLLLIVAACVVKQFCQPTGRNMERLHIIARSPINGHLNSTLEGLTTIRACNAQEIVTDEYDKHQDLFISAYFMVVTVFISLNFYLKFASVVFIGTIMTQLLVTDTNNDVGEVGLVITVSFTIAGIVRLGILCVADCENLMISVERILEYTKLEEEAREGKILIGWPKTGSVSFRNVSLNNGNKKILTDINFALNSGEKLGVIGRTGAGKSSIISCLFRLYPTNGEIIIDGVNLQDVSIGWLRSNISVIPQDPYLFSGTVRENLDPLKQHADDQIWKILKELRFDFIDDLNAKIDKGMSFSAGQKQLLCLARVILRKNKIVVLDEATANVDRRTESLMQEAIHKHFGECTMIVIAHRLLAVMSCDKIMVLDRGKICEFDEAVKLMQNKNSLFYKQNN